MSAVPAVPPLPLWVCLLALWSDLPASAAARPGILTTLAPIYSWTASIAGPDADVENLIPPNVGPHSFQLRAQDPKRIRQADLIIANGLGIDDWLDKAIQSNTARAAAPRVLKVTTGWTNDLIYHVPVLRLESHPSKPPDADHHHPQGDQPAEARSANPHLWLDPIFARYAVSNILEALVRLDPAHGPGYTARANAYQVRLTTLDDQIRKVVSALPGKSIVTYHDAFPYFCRRYQLDLVGVIEENPGVEPTPRYKAWLSRVIRARGVRVIFTEPQSNPRGVEQLSRDLGVPFAVLDVLETGPAKASFYDEAMRRNLATLQAMLGK